MKHFRKCVRFLRLSGSDESRAEVEDELAHHIDLTTQELLAQGMDPEEARREAERRFGDLDRFQRQCVRYERRRRRAERGRETLVTFRQDLRYACRKMVQNPGFTAIALLSLALGIGANTAVFSLTNAMLIRESPFRDAQELVDLFTVNPGFSNGPFSYPDYLDLVEGSSSVFKEIGASSITFGQTEERGRVTSLMVELVTGGYFPLLGMEPFLGRTLLPDDDVVRDGHFVVVLGYNYWQSAYGADPGVLGKTLQLSGDHYEIVGVAPKDYLGFLRGFRPDVLVSVQMMGRLQGPSVDPLGNRESYSFFPKARVAPGVSREEVDVTLETLSRNLRRAYPEAWDDEGMRFKAVSSESIVVNPSIDGVIVPILFMALVVVGLVLLIACANLASFLLARAADRRKEVAIRLAMGAGRGTLVRQLLTEAMVLAVPGGALGLVLGLWLVGLLPRLNVPLPVKFGLDLGLDGTVLGLTTAATLLAGLFFGLAPALQATNQDVAGTLKDESTGGGRPKRITLRKALVVGQVAASLALLVSAGLLLRSLQARGSTDPGFGRDPAAIVSFTLRSYATAQEGRIALQEILEGVSGLPGVQAVGLTNNLPFNPIRISTLDFLVDGVSPAPGQNTHEVDECIVGPGFFDAVGIPLVRGRNFGSADGPDDQGVVIINQVMAERFWPGQDPLGRTIRRETGEELVVVGVARSAKVRSLSEAPRPFIYRSFHQYYSSLPMVVARTAGPAEGLLPAMIEVIRGVDPDVVFVDSKTMQDHLAVVLLPARIGALLSVVFAGIALILASIGLYGVVSHAVASRSREMGIRISLGADTRGVVALMVRGGMKLVLVGGVAGLALSLLVSTGLRRFLYGVPLVDPATFLGVPALLLGVALLAAYIPARRAGRVDPVKTLRTE